VSDLNSDSFLLQVFFKSSISSSSTKARNDWIAEGQAPIAWVRGDKWNSSSSIAFAFALAFARALIFKGSSSINFSGCFGSVA
jgi:hypothetical protein